MQTQYNWYPVLGFLWSSTPQFIFLKSWENTVFPEDSSWCSPVALAVPQDKHELWTLSCRTDISDVGIQLSPTSFSLWTEKKVSNNIAQDVWKEGWLMLHVQKINRFGNISSVVQVFLGAEHIPKFFTSYHHYKTQWNLSVNYFALLSALHKALE